MDFLLVAHTALDRATDILRSAGMIARVISRVADSAVRVLGALRARRFEAAIIVFYVVPAAVFGEHYPLSPLEMFAAPPSGVGRLQARTEGGSVLPITDFVDWNCEHGLDDLYARLPTECFPDRGAGIATMRLEYLRRHTSAEPVGEPITLVRRVWQGDAQGALRDRECVVDRCSARRVNR
jgi:hypothetical protein